MGRIAKGFSTEAELNALSRSWWAARNDRAASRSGRRRRAALRRQGGRQTKARVVVVGGGFGGATAARFLRQYDPALEVTLLEPNDTFIACPFSNAVIAGERGLDAQRFGYGAIR